MAPRLLIVEDDEIQRSVLQSALEKRGYEIEVAPDGLTAVRMLRTGGFDLALMDYQLPDIDGLASARLMHELMAEEDCPKLIAVTSSSDALSRRELSGSVFDAIVSKPLDLPALFATISTQLHATAADQTMRMAEAEWQKLGLASAPAVVVFPPPTAIKAHVLRSFFDLSGRREPEAVLLLAPEAIDDAVSARCNSALSILPFVDLSGTHANSDAVFSAADPATWGSVAAAITRFAEQRRIVAHTALQATDLDTRLLVYLFLSGRTLQPTFDFASLNCVSYPGFFGDSEIREAAERLAIRGLLQRRFFDRFHACGSCGSSRLNTREECPACRSAQLKDVPLVHHFRCAHQAPEADFIRGPHLVCPKCRQHLRHYGSDYDKPGTVTNCSDCGTSSPEPVVGFVCLDCDAHTDGDAVTKRDVFSYALTPDGVALLRRGTVRVSATPLHAKARLPEAVEAILARVGSVSAVAELRYGARGRIVARRGEAGFAAMRRLFIENVVNAIGGECELSGDAEADYLVIRSAPPGALVALGPELLEACQEVLAEGLEPELRYHDAPAQALLS